MLPKIEDIDAETLALVESLLPRVALDFVRVIGLESTLALIREFGGTQLSFPKSPTGPASARFHELAEVIGAGNVIKMAGEYLATEEVYVPRCLYAINALRNREITILFGRMPREMGVQTRYNKLARLFRCSCTSIEHIVNGKVGQVSKRPSRAKAAATDPA